MARRTKNNFNFFAVFRNDATPPPREKNHRKQATEWGSIPMQSKLFERDWRSLMEAILRINSTEDIELLQHVALECIQTLIPSDQYAFFISRAGTAETLGEPYILGIEAKFLDRFMAGSYNSDEDSEAFFSGYHILTHATETTRDSDQIPEDYLVSTSIYR